MPKHDEVPSIPLLDLEAGNRTEKIEDYNEHRNESLSISWQNLTATTKKGTRILNDITGGFPSQSLSAILGRSGSGKDNFYEHSDR